MHFVKTPFILIADQFDDYQMSINLNGKTTHKELTEPEQVYATNFGAFTKEYLTQFDFSKSGNHGAILSTACGYHAVSVSDRFFSEKTIANVTQSNVLSEALGEFEGGKEF